MAKKEVIEADKALRELFQQRGINISKIIVFGSYAREKEVQDSDIDIIIISKDFRNKDIFEKVELTKGVHMWTVYKKRREEWDSVS